MPTEIPRCSSESDLVVPHTFGVIQLAAEETITDSSYYFHNGHRQDGSGLAVQLTVKGAAFFEDQNGRRLVLPDHAMFFSHTEESTYGYQPLAAEPYVHRFIQMSDCPALRNVFDRIVARFGVIVRMPEKSEARDLFNEIVERFRVHRFRDRYEESELLYRMLMAVYREQVDGPRVQDPIEYGHHLICNRLSKAANLKEIAQRCGVTREYFTREFKRRYQQTPGQLLRRLRLEHAELLLKTTSKAVVDISAAAGFSSCNAFGRTFKRIHRQSPSDFRAAACRPGR